MKSTNSFFESFEIWDGIYGTLKFEEELIFQIDFIIYHLEVVVSI